LESSIASLGWGAVSLVTLTATVLAALVTLALAVDVSGDLANVASRFVDDLYVGTEGVLTRRTRNEGLNLQVHLTLDSVYNAKPIAVAFLEGANDSGIA
jgi:hypothetical protein